MFAVKRTPRVWLEYHSIKRLWDNMSRHFTSLNWRRLRPEKNEKGLLNLFHSIGQGNTTILWMCIILQKREEWPQRKLIQTSSRLPLQPQVEGVGLNISSGIQRMGPSHCLGVEPLHRTTRVRGQTQAIGVDSTTPSGPTGHSIEPKTTFLESYHPMKFVLVVLELAWNLSPLPSLFLPFIIGMSIQHLSQNYIEKHVSCPVSQAHSCGEILPQDELY